jgi:tryptophan-rich sensory protein
MRISIESSTSYRGRNSRPNLPALTAFVALALGTGESARVGAVAALVLTPYFLWVSFAAAMNLAIWKLNP